VATSRTGTARWKLLRTTALRSAQDSGLTHCPCAGPCRHHAGRPCGVPLDYEQGRTPSSAEPDHITPHARGGRDELANIRVVCRRCNQARGGRSLRASTPAAPATTTTLVDW